ncbi:multidrug effflux MFS transporter [Pseudomonas putida]|uniref:multidrug effflux MFS transporter n=1 Tax=Pseudomonas putida TaxID=303 RepID=UPI00226E6BDD|nr:multidrug effflux MFS transporter [Pseudomonas putida]WAB98050.1 multidrug effflux MFS transporter [Pseudomonas putida]
MKVSIIVLLGGLSILGPLGIDMYLPAFGAMSAELQVSRLVIQQTLGLYLACLAIMMLFYGTLSDVFGRRVVLLWATAIHALAALGVALAASHEGLLAWRALQGLSAGAGGVVARAVVLDMTRGVDTQRAMSQLIMVFALAPALAPILGGWILESFGWRSIFIFQAAFAALLFVCCYRYLAESLATELRQVLRMRPLLLSYLRTSSDAGFQLPVIAGALAFFVFSLYIGASASFVMDVLGLPVTAFGWLFVPLVAGMVLGSAFCGWLARRLSRCRQLGLGYAILLAASFLNVGYWLAFEPVLPWLVLPLGLTTFGLALINPCLILMATERYQQHRGLSNSLLSFEQTLVFAAVTAWLAPLLAGSGLGLACAVALGALASGVCAWWATQHVEFDPEALAHPIKN